MEGVGTDGESEGAIVVEVVVVVAKTVVEVGDISALATERFSILGRVFLVEAEGDVAAAEVFTRTTASKSGRGAVVSRFFANQSLMYSRRSLLYSSFCSSVIPDR